MKLPTKAVWLAVHRIFSLEHVTAGCSLSLKNLMGAWSGTGMRMADLAEGLEALMHSGSLSLEIGDEGPCVRLLDERFGLVDFGADDRNAASTVQQLRKDRSRPTHLGSLLTCGEGRRNGERPGARQAT